MLTAYCASTGIRCVRAALATASLAATLLVPAPGHARQPSPTPQRAFTADDLVRLERLSDPQLAPDGNSAVYVLRETDMEANRGRTGLWLLDLRGRDARPRRLTGIQGDDSNPRWSATGDSVYFLSERSGSSQVWKLPVTGGEAMQVTDFPVAVGGFLLAPRGDRLLFTADVFRDCPDLACTRERLNAASRRKETGRAVDQLFVRHWDTWRDGTRSVLWSAPLGTDGRAGAPVPLSASLDGDTPPKPFGDTREYGIAPDGERVAFAIRVAGREEAWSTNLDIYEVPVTGGTPRNLTAGNLATDTRPAYSPDGRWLAWLAMARPGFEADRLAVKVMERATGRVWELSRGWDRSADTLAWSADSGAIYVTADDLGNKPLFRLPVRAFATAKVERLTGPGSVEAVAAAGRRIAYVLQDLGSSAQLYLLEGRKAEGRRLTQVNAERLAAVRMAEYEPYSFTGAAGDTVHGWVMKPWDWQAGQRYPLAFIVHGGPQGSFGNDWSYRWNPQVFAGAGYAVVFVDFHGSTGYGQAFTDSISRDWGGKPLEDLKAGLAAAAARFPWIDAGRGCALGASYGGYMMNWIAGNWTDGFRCIVDHAGILDTRAMGYTTEELWFEEWEQGGTPWDPAADYEKWNPVSFVGQWRTPMLVTLGERDFRVPYTQGLGTFTALQRRGIESRLVVFPDENHWILKPANSLEWHREVLGWLDAHLRH